MAPTPRAMKSMKAAAASNTMTVSQSYKSVAETTGLKTKDVKSVVEAVMEVAAEELKKSGSFKLAGMLNMKLKTKPATKARKGLNPFTKEPCVFKAKPASKTVKVLPLKKLKDRSEKAELSCGNSDATHAAIGNHTLWHRAGGGIHRGA
eukprot:CAMPEP_0178398952 /NCGR_PEP_ID=MMETSP0689_2-20121128/15032_1 /TAXON_ID=160604 /ORGANISM="Amphidinium massartii, Strain CS-259" /LENGTH=148 /DNA_ID=CAMNT_0020019719 /DNA_START=105 /DNA_END=548 /DNA_ORIENTATION=+